MSELREAAKAVVREFWEGGSVSTSLFLQLPQPAFMALVSLAEVLTGDPANVVEDGPIGPASQPEPNA